MFDDEDDRCCGFCGGGLDWTLTRRAGALFEDEVAIDVYSASCARRCAASEAAGNAGRRDRPRARSA